MRTASIVLLGMALAVATTAGATYKCVNEKGVTLIGDTPPEGCEHVEMYEVGPSGRVIRKIDPTPSPDQQKAYAESADKRRAEEKAAADQKRKDAALLNTYSNEKEIDTARDRNIEPIKGRIKSSQARAEDVDKRLKQIDDEMEFYKAGKTGKGKDAGRGGDQLKADLASLQKEKATIEKSIKGYEKEIESTKAKYDVDKKRWLALKSGGPIPGAGAPK